MDILKRKPTEKLEVLVLKFYNKYKVQTL